MVHAGKSGAGYCPVHTGKHKNNMVSVRQGNITICASIKTGGYKVIFSHIEDGKDFFLYEPDEPYDVIISNPPYSKKDAVYERLFQLGKPWAMLVGMNGLFDSKKRFGMFREHGCQILVPDGRTKFISKTDGTLLQPPFQAIYVCWRLLPEAICFEKDPVESGNSLWGQERMEL